MGIRLGFAVACVTASLLASSALAADEPGVTATEIKIGGIFPFSGPASSIGLVGGGVVAYVQLINDRGGINGRKINYIAMDDAYSPPKAVEHARKLVESDEVSFIFGQLGEKSALKVLSQMTSDSDGDVRIQVTRAPRAENASRGDATNSPCGVMSMILGGRSLITEYVAFSARQTRPPVG